MQAYSSRESSISLDEISIDEIGADIIGEQDYNEKSDNSDESVAELFHTTQKRMIAVQIRQRNILWQHEYIIK